ncbi:MAG: EAL domain-containing protein [Parasphingorhabdus sp.]|uniref:EAL domain-containing protein n=1 Tax=Parasphingorhabdus sp. TaxID=2709688 RepID=UPI00329965A7
MALLEVLPHAAAYVDSDGCILLNNTKLVEACDDAGLLNVPGRLSDLFSSSSWRRCEAVLSAAFTGIPAQATGIVALKSGEVFCNHLVCTSFVSLSGENPAVLVQFELDGVGTTDGENSEPHTQPVGASILAEMTDRLLKNFPDDVLIFDGSESPDEKAKRLLNLMGNPYDSDLLAECIVELTSNTPQALYIPETEGRGLGGSTADRRMCEIRLVPLPALQGNSDLDGASMAIMRRNVDCPHEVAENRRLAYLDPLTGLANRRAFTRALKLEMQRLASDDGSTGLAVLYIDLDEFKKVNDLGGHDAGDDMLMRVASCLSLTLGEFGTAARIGGDEFAAMIPAMNADAALETAERILDGFAGIRLEISDRVFTIGGSIGVAFVENDSLLKNCDASAVLGLADRACLRGKRFGGQSVQIHSVQANDCTSSGSELIDLPEPGSFRANELTLYSMPIMCLQRNQQCGSEVLLRLQGERASGLSSRAWISAAERSGFIAQVDAWTLDKVLDAAERNTQRSILTMNVSVGSARDPNFRDVLFHRLSVNPLLASKLCLEISEKDFLREPTTVESFFRFVAELGCQTAIDDFAGHWPVFSRLTSLPVDWLKLASGLTQQVSDDPAKVAILKGLVAVTKDLGIKVIAKHVEREEEVVLLQDLKIEAAQGYYFGKPKPWPGA